MASENMHKEQVDLYQTHSSQWNNNLSGALPSKWHSILWQFLDLPIPLRKVLNYFQPFLSFDREYYYSIEFVMVLFPGDIG
jgi:hypothetical protein